MFSRITVHLPVDGLLFWKLNGSEKLSDAFELTVQLLGSDARIDRKALLGQPISVAIPTQGLLGGTRWLNGKITRVGVHSQELNGTRYAVYSLVMEPDVWPMKRDRNLRI
ncbi:contractile injection system protein, VgrG/Pvc8 family, partial [Erwinia psidii]